MYPAVTIPSIYDQDDTRKLNNRDFNQTIGSYDTLYMYGLMKQLYALQKNAIEIFKDLDIGFQETEARLYQLQSKTKKFNEFSAKVIHKNSKLNNKIYKHPSKAVIEIPPLKKNNQSINNYFIQSSYLADRPNFNDFEGLVDNVEAANLEISDPSFFRTQFHKEQMEEHSKNLVNEESKAMKTPRPSKKSAADELYDGNGIVFPFDEILPPNVRLNPVPPKGSTDNWRHKGHYQPRTAASFGVGGTGKRVPKAARGIQVGGNKKTNMMHQTVDIFENEPRNAPLLKLISAPKLPSYPIAVSVPTVPIRTTPKLIDCAITTKATKAGFGQMEMRQRVDLDLSFVVRNDFYLVEKAEVQQAATSGSIAPPPPPPVGLPPPPPPPPVGLPPPSSGPSTVGVRPQFDLSSAPKLKKVDQTSAPSTQDKSGRPSAEELQREIQERLSKGLRKVTDDMKSKSKTAPSTLTHLDLIKMGNFKLRKISETNRPPPKDFKQEKEVDPNSLSLEELVMRNFQRREGIKESSSSDSEADESSESW